MKSYADDNFIKWCENRNVQSDFHSLEELFPPVLYVGEDCGEKFIQILNEREEKLSKVLSWYFNYLVKSRYKKQLTKVVKKMYLF